MLTKSIPELFRRPTYPSKLAAAMVVTMLIQLFWDVSVSNGIVDWIVYLIPVFISGWVGGRNFSYRLAAVITVLMIGAYCYSPPLVEPDLSLEAHLAGICAIWMSAMLIAFLKDSRMRLLRTERALKMVSECDQMLVRADDETDLLKKICQTIVDIGDYRLAWVGFPECDEKMSVRTIAAAGPDSSYLDGARITWNEEKERGRGPVGIALRTGNPVVCNDFLNDPRTVPWHASARKFGFASAICLPLKVDGKNIGVLMFYSSSREAFNSEEVKLLVELSEDLAFGMHSLRTRNRLGEVQHNLETLVQSMPEAVFLKDGQGRWMVINDVASRLFKTDQRPWYGRSDIELAADLEELRGVHETCAASDELAWQAGKLVIGEEQVPMVDGRAVVVETYKQPLFYPDGRRKGLVVIGRDITERKQRTAEIARARDYYLCLLESAPALIWRAGVDAKCDWFNSGWLKFTGRKMEEETGDGWIAGVHPDDLAHNCVESYLDAFQARQPFELEYRLRRHDGEYRWILDQGAPFYGLDGNFNGYLGFCFDITERKHRETYNRLHLQVLQLLAADAPLREVLGSIVALLECGHDDWMGSIMLVDGSNPRLYCGAAPRLPREFLDGINDVPIQVGAGSCGTAAATKQGVIVEDVLIHPYWIDYQALCGRAGLRACWSTPVISPSGKVIGTLAVYRSKPGAPTEKELDDIKNVVDLAGVAISKSIAEAALHESNRRLQLALGAAHMGIWEFDVTKQRWYWSPEFYEMFGLPPMEPARELLEKRMPPEDWKASVAALERALNQYAEYHCEYRIQAGDEIMWIEDRGRVIRDENGRPLRVVGTAQDITGRKLQASKLEAQRRFLSDLVENSSLLIFVKDLAGRYLMVNRAFETSVGRRRNDILGRNDKELFPGQNRNSIEQNDQQVMQAGSNQTFEEALANPDGSMRYFVSIKFPICDDKESITGMCGMLMEITDRRRLEEERLRLATVVEQASEAIFITDLKSCIQYVNPAFETITGYSREEALGKTPNILKSGQHDGRFYRNLYATLQKGQTWKGHFINRRKDGGIYEEDAIISPIRNSHGEVINYVAVKHDVTREVQLEAQVRQAQKMEAIGTLAGGIAHDFNNILMAVYGWSNLLQLDSAITPGQREMVDEILKSANRAKDLVEQILTFSRQREQTRRWIQLAPVVKEATKFLRSSLPPGVEVNLELVPEDRYVRADPTQIYQVIMNLATNSVHALEGRRGSLTITLNDFTPSPDFLAAHNDFRPIHYTALGFADNGCGMDRRTLERVFEPFFTTKPVGKGTGLGLAVVHGIVRSHDAHITVDSSVDAGTTFRIYFPAQEHNPEEINAENEELPRGNHQEILLIDDETAITNVLKRLLDALDFKVTVSNHPREAIEILRRAPDQFDLVITDFVMPEVDGLHVAMEIKSIRPQIPIILVSGYTTHLNRDTFGRCGIAGFFAKPISAKEVAQTIQSILSGHSLASDLTD